MVKQPKYNEIEREFTNAANAKARGNAQANIIIIPNCKASSKQSAFSIGVVIRLKKEETVTEDLEQWTQIYKQMLAHAHTY